MITAKHREHLRASGLTDETIEAAGIESGADCIRFPVRPGLVVERPDAPIDDRKYKWPPGQALEPYFSARGAAPNDPTAPLLVTEGIKKILAATQALPTVAGVAWPGLFVHDAEERRATGEWRLHPELARLPLKGRTVFIAFDSADVATKAAVALGEARTASLFLEAGADVRLVRVPAEGHKGALDDALVLEADPRAALSSWLEAAIPADPVTRARAVADLDQAAALVKDLSFLAAVKVRSKVELDLVKDALEAHGIGRSTIEAQAKWLHDKLTPVRRDAPAAQLATGEEWRLGLATGKKGEILCSPGNALRVVAGLFGPSLYFDELEAAPRWSAPPPWDPSGGGPRTLRDSDADFLCKHLETAEGLFFQRDKLDRALSAVAEERRVDRIGDYLRSLKWDGIERIGHWLSEFANAANDRYTQEVGRRWLISGAARGLNPGCKADHVMVLAGPQGIGKSMLFRSLVPDPRLFVDEALDLASKDSVLQVGAAWLWEIAELDGFSRSDIDSLKAFVSRQVDKVRPPYGRRVIERPRRCVLAGTTNSDAFLLDQTGNRRFWVVRVEGPIRTDLAAAARDQLWAEAVAAYDAGERWWFGTDEGELLAAAQEHQDAATHLDPWVESLAEWAEGRTAVSTAEAFLHLDRPAGMVTRADEMRMGAVLRQLGFTDRVRSTEPPRKYTYRRPTVLPRPTSGQRR